MQSQYSLFADEAVQLVHDAEGGIRYWPNFVGGVTAAEWFEALRMKADAEKFFRSAWFTMLCDLDGEALMKQIYDMEFHVWKRRFQR